MSGSPVGTSTGSSSPIPAPSSDGSARPEVTGPSPGGTPVPVEVDGGNVTDGRADDTASPDVVTPGPDTLSNAATSVEEDDTGAGFGSGAQRAAGEASASGSSPGTGSPPSSVSGSAVAGRSSFAALMTAVAVVAGGIQALFIHAVSHRSALPAAGRYDTVQAHFLVRGQWFIDPARAVAAAHAHVPTAAHPPLPTLLLAIADVASAGTSTKHMVFLAMVFVASVVVAGITVRDLVGERAGVLAALVFATFPYLWVNPATVGPETTVIAVTTVTLFASVRFWGRPSSAHAALVGLALGLCALTRTDLVALILLIGLPLGLLVRGVPWGTRIRGLAVMGVVVLVVVGPWVGRNLAVFDHTVVLSEDYGPVVAGANCPATASGDLEGWWSPTCLARVPASASPASVTADQFHVGRAYVTDHPGTAAGVAAVRLGRIWNVYRPLQGSELEVGTGRPAWVSRLGLWYFYVLVPVAIVGALVLRRRRLLVFPFLALIVLSSLTAVLAFGDARFAVEADVSMAMLAGVALDALVNRLRARGSSRPGLHSARRSRAVS